MPEALNLVGPKLRLAKAKHGCKSARISRLCLAEYPGARAWGGRGAVFALLVVSTKK
jgi:hypothetical protein